MRIKELTRIFRAAANEKRIRIVKALMVGDKTMNELSDYTGLPYKTVERHLKILVSVNLVNQHRDGLTIDFSINNDARNHFHTRVLDLIREVS